MRVDGGHELTDESVATLRELLSDVAGGRTVIEKLRNAVQTDDVVEFDWSEAMAVRGVLQQGVEAPEGDAARHPQDLVGLYRLLGWGAQ